MTATTLLPDRNQAQVVYLEWNQYLLWLSGKLRAVANAAGDRVQLGPPLEPGQHMPGIGPTGCRKTTHIAGIADHCRKYIFALDPKGGDKTLAQLGYPRVRQIPRRGWRGLVGEDQKTWREIQKRIDSGQPARVIVTGSSRTEAEDVRLQQLLRDAIAYCRSSPGWTLLCDEFELISSQRMFRLGPMIERMLITARDDSTSVLTTYQAPAWVSKHAIRQAAKAVVWQQDVDMIKNVARGMNWPWREVAAVTDELPYGYSVTLGRGKLAGPMVITKAPRLAA